MTDDLHLLDTLLGDHDSITLKRLPHNAVRISRNSLVMASGDSLLAAVRAAWAFHEAATPRERRLARGNARTFVAGEDAG